ncbi:unnamed protein product [Calypogeia fissa]
MAASESDGSDEDFDAWFGRELKPKIPARELMQAPRPSTTPKAWSQHLWRNAIRQAYVPSLSGKTLEQVFVTPASSHIEEKETLSNVPNRHKWDT